MKKIYLITAVVVLLGIAALFIFQSQESRPRNSISNDGYSYIVKFEGNLKDNSQNGKKYLVSNDGKLSVIVSKSANISDCGDRGAQVTDKITIMNKQYSLCRLNNSNPDSSLYTANFQTDNTWHTIAIFSTDSRSPVDKEVAKSVASSVELSR